MFYTLTGVDSQLEASEQAAANLSSAPATAVALQQLAYRQVSPAPLPVRLVAFSAPRRRRGRGLGLANGQ